LRLKIRQIRNILKDKKIQNRKVIEVFDQVSGGLNIALKPGNQKIHNFVFIDLSSHTGFLEGHRVYQDDFNAWNHDCLELLIVFLERQEKGSQKIRLFELHKEFESGDLEEFLGEDCKFLRIFL
jgi:hypothetical protein